MCFNILNPEAELDINSRPNKTYYDDEEYCEEYMDGEETIQYHSAQKWESESDLYDD